jgi:glycosyltransferase involved in cell wall biosynthesis
VGGKKIATKMKTICVVIPAWNERDGMEKTIKAIPKSELKNAGYEVQVLVVDGGSVDGTAELAKEAGAEVIIEPRRGYGRAYKTGFAHAKSDIIITADADGTYPLEDIPRLLRIMKEEKLDFLTTNRLGFMEKGAMSFRNKLGNTILGWEIRLLFGINIKDPESGMWIFKIDILPSLRLDSDIWPFSHEIKIEACYFNKCCWREVPIRYKARYGGIVKLTGGWNGWKAGVTDLLNIVKKRVAR